MPIVRLRSPAGRWLRLAGHAGSRDLEQVSELGRGIGTDVNRITDAGGIPGARIKPACRRHAGSFHLDASRGGLPVNVIEHAASRGEVEKVASLDPGPRPAGTPSPPPAPADPAARPGRIDDAVDDRAPGICPPGSSVSITPALRARIRSRPGSSGGLPGHTCTAGQRPRTAACRPGACPPAVNSCQATVRLADARRAGWSTRPAPGASSLRHRPPGRPAAHPP